MLEGRKAIQFMFYMRKYTSTTVKDKRNLKQGVLLKPAAPKKPARPERDVGLYNPNIHLRTVIPIMPLWVAGSPQFRPTTSTNLNAQQASTSRSRAGLVLTNISKALSPVSKIDTGAGADSDSDSNDRDRELVESIGNKLNGVGDLDNTKGKEGKQGRKLALPNVH